MSRTIRKLFRHKNPYNLNQTETLFLKGLQETCQDWMQSSSQYLDICKGDGFDVNQIQTLDDIHNIPLIPTVYFKRNALDSSYKSVTEVTSSGTSGKVSNIGYSLNDLINMTRMAVSIGRVHHNFSIRPTHYIILGYKPHRNNKTVISKTASLSMLYAFPISVRYALRMKQDNYELDLEALIERIEYISKRKTPVRILGFPAYTFFMLQMMKDRGLKVQCPKGSRILFGGGWKQFAGQAVSKDELYALVEAVLGINREHISEFFGAAEHPILYQTCTQGHFHVPIYARVLIRDVETLEPLNYGQTGILNVITPLHTSLPIPSVITDDLAILHPASSCGCAIQSDWFEILGRVGVQDVQTCAQGAQDYLKEDV